ncbi:MAG: ANTAR domain-containing response regulator [Eubacteriales bacterium]
MKTAKPSHRVLVVSGGRQAFDSISGFLPPGEYEPVLYAPSAGEAKRMLSQNDADILIINTPLPDEFGIEFALGYTDRSMGILLLCKSELYEQVAYRVEDAGILTLPKPVNRQVLYTSVKLLSATTEKLKLWEKKNESLREKMADIRVVNRAKWLLISRLGMTEEDAHYYIEKQAMDTRISRREAAEEIIRAYDT